MDPNANLKEQAEQLLALSTTLSTVQTFRAVHSLDWSPIDVRSFHDARRQARARLALLRADLMDWLNAGGFAPDWQRFPAAARYYTGARVAAMSGQPRTLTCGCDTSGHACAMHRR